MLKWDISKTGIAHTNLPLFYEPAGNWVVDYFHDLTLFMVAKKSNHTATTDSIAFQLSNPSLYTPALYTDKYGLKYACLLRGKQTVREKTQSDFGASLTTLNPAAALRFVKFVLGDSGHLNQNSVVHCEIFFSTPIIPPTGSVKIELPSTTGITVPASKYGYFCQPGQNVLRSSKDALKCTATAANTFELSGFATIPQSNVDAPANILQGDVISIKFIAEIVPSTATNDVALTKVEVYGTPALLIIRADSSNTNCVASCPVNTPCASLCDTAFDTETGLRI